MTGAGWYSGRRVFLTGHTGFKGAWLSAWLAELGAEVTGFALAAEPGSLYEALGLDDAVTSVIGDIRDLDAVRAAMTAARPEVVIHMAAQSLVRPSYDDPAGTFATNVQGTVHVLEAMRGMEGLRAGLIVTSDKCYENTGDGRPMVEGGALGGSDPYSASKGAAEVVTQSYARSFFASGPCRIASARAGNVIGGGDWATDRIVPDLARSAFAGEPTLIRRPRAIRPWQHVLEPLSAYLLIARSLASADVAATGAWNIGPDPSDAVPVIDVARRLAAAWPAITYTESDAEIGPYEAPTLLLDSRRIRQRLGWRPMLDIGQALDMTAAWYRAAHAAPEDAGRVTREQIRSYMELRGVGEAATG